MAGLLSRLLTRAADPGPNPPGGGRALTREASPCGIPGDFHGVPRMEWAADADGQPDPGGWSDVVPFEEDHSRGKDRPVLLIGRDGRWLLTLPLTSKDHDRDRVRSGAPAGSGSTSARAAGTVRSAERGAVNRIIRVDAARIRREGRSSIAGSSSASPRPFAHRPEAFNRKGPVTHQW